MADIKNETNLDILKKMADKENTFVESKNYYFQTHDCLNESNVKINLNFIFENESDGTILRLGHCEKCKTTFYNKTFNAKTF